MSTVVLLVRGAGIVIVSGLRVIGRVLGVLAMHVDLLGDVIRIEQKSKEVQEVDSSE